MTGLLNFNADRSLGFSLDRALEFDITRPLGFDPNRTLGFRPNRDLGFGKRGVMFRGFVCGECGAITSSEATVCNECGAVFEIGETARRPIPQTERPAAPTVVRAPGPPTPRTESAPAKGGTRVCPTCGARTWSGDAFCWNCGTRFGGMGPSVPPSRPPSSPRATDAAGPAKKRAKKVRKNEQTAGSSSLEGTEER